MSKKKVKKQRGEGKEQLKKELDKNIAKMTSRKNKVI